MLVRPLRASLPALLLVCLPVSRPLDFFGALRARVYDDEVRKWVAEIGVENVSKKLVNSRAGPPKFQQPSMSLEVLMHYGNMLVREQENVKRVQLADVYLDSAALGDANKDQMEQGTFFEGENTPRRRGEPRQGAEQAAGMARTAGSIVY